jgi:hypothetical protein
MPGEADLPPSLQELAYRNGMSIRHDPHFHADVDLLIKNMETLASAPSLTTSASNPIPALLDHGSKFPPGRSSRYDLLNPDWP